MALACLSLLTTARVHAAPIYPSPKENYINDFAGVLDSTDVSGLRKELKDLESQTGIEGTVVTVNSMADYGGEGMSIESFATGLFNSWGVGNKKKNNGFMILLSVQDRRCRIELGDGYGSQYNRRMQEIVDQQMVPRFRAGEYSRGVFDGTLAVTDSVTKKVSWLHYHQWHVVAGLAIIVCLIAGVNCMKQGENGWGFAFFAAAGAILMWLLSALSSKGSSSSSFGGGSSSGGGGASGSW
jgi:uncharacterized protein